MTAVARRALAVAVALVAAVAGVAAAQPTAELPDYDPKSDAWQGMSAFVALAGGMGFAVDARSTFDWSALTRDDVLVLVYPLQRVDPAKLANFVQAGGNVVIADDFGQGRDAMTALGLWLDVDRAPRAGRYYEGRVWAPIATAAGGAKDHPLALGIEDNDEHGVVTNHPAALGRVTGATRIVGFDDGAAVVVAGERGNGRFVAVSDPSIFINRMQQFAGNIQLATNILSWLRRADVREPRIVLVRGDVPMFGEPRPVIDDAKAGELGRSIADLNLWLSRRSEWLLTAGAMKALAAALAATLLLLAIVALPVRRGPRIDGAWLRFGRPVRRDEPHALIASADRGSGALLVVACMLRDEVQQLLATAVGKAEPLYTMSESELSGQLAAARGNVAALALARVYKQLRALPSRGQAAAPWSAGQLARREFDALYRDVAELCRTLGAELVEARTDQA